MFRSKLYFIAALVWAALILENAYSLDFNSLTDQSSYRCSEALVAIGDSERSVREKCGDPIEIAAVPDYGPIWIYGQEGDRFMYYLEFVDGKLQRILAAPCRIDDPSCFDLR
jgi:hypothetical protein